MRPSKTVKLAHSILHDLKSAVAASCHRGMKGMVTGTKIATILEIDKI